MNMILKKMNRKLLTAAIFLGLIFPGGGLTAQDKVVDQILAVVGSNIILKSDVEEMSKQVQAQGHTTEGDMKCEIFEQFLIDKLLVAEAMLDTNIVVTDSEINQHLEARINEYIMYLGSEKNVENYFKKPIMAIKAELKENIKDMIYSRKMRETIVKNVTVTPSEVRLFYRNLKDEEIPVVEPQFEYRQITFAPHVEVDEENRVKAELREYKRRVEDGEIDFASLAVLYSEAPEQRSGGEIGYKGRAELDPAYSAAAFNLRDDKISNVVKSEFGYHIIQLIDRKGESINTRHILLKPKISPEDMQLAQNKLDSLANMIRKNEIPFEQAAMLFSSDKNSRNNGGLAINPNTMSTKFGLTELDPYVSKVITTMKINEISDPFRIVDSNTLQTVYKIIRLISKTEGHKANLQSDYQLISNLYLEKKQQEALQKWIALRQSQTYIRIDRTYANCNYQYKNWIK